MKKKILLAILLALVFTCIFAISVSAEPVARYRQFDVELVDGSKITVYEAESGWDQWQGRIFLTENTYLEAPLDTEGTYTKLDLTKVKVIDYTNAANFSYDADKGEYVEKNGTNNGHSLNLYRENNNFTSKNYLTSLEKVITGNVTTVGSSLFSGITTLKDVVFSSKLRTIDSNAFDGCTGLEEVDFSGCPNFSSLSGQVFIRCSGLKNVVLPESFSYFGSDVFNGCSSLTTFDWPEKIKTISGGLFNGCTSLQFEIPSYITSIGGSAFQNCDALTVINVPLSVTSIGGYAFAQCDNLTAVNFAENNQITGEFTGIVMSCPKLASFKIPAGVTKLTYDNFWHCTSLTEIDISGITEITKSNNFADTAIKKLVFSNELVSLPGGNIGHSVEEIRFGANIQSIGDGNFCSVNLKRVYLPATVTTIGARILGYSNSADSSQNITFIFTGTKEQAEALQAYYEEWTLANNPGHAPNSSKFYDAELVSAKDYDINQEPSGFHFVYDYSQCVAFYNGVHGNTVTTYGFEGAEYFTAYQSTTGCDRCTDKDVVDIANALFTYKGFSTDGNSIVYDIRINKDAIEKYNAATGREIKYGIVASQIFNDGALLDNEGVIVDNRVVSAEFSSFDYTILQIKILNVAEDLKTTPIHCCAYVVDNSKVKYLYDTKDAEGKAVPNAFDVANQVTYAQANGQ